MNLPVQPGAGVHDNQDSGALRRRTSVTESGAQSTNVTCRAGDGTVRVSTTSTDGTVGAVGMTLDEVSELAMTLAGAAVSTVVAPEVAPTVSGHGSRLDTGCTSRTSIEARRSGARQRGRDGDRDAPAAGAARLQNRLTHG